jgi:predicted HAD superfamily Cof-like phosphohydrolase
MSINTTSFKTVPLAALRRRLIDEEHAEVFLAFEQQDDENLLKELCDLVYVCVGTAVAFGWDFDEAFKRVHQSNMSKLGVDGKPIFRDDGKVLKGPNYRKADLSDLV